MKRKPTQPDTDSLSRQVTWRILLLSVIGVIGLVLAMSLALTTNIERVKRKLDRASTQAVLSFDLFILNIRSDLVATGASLSTATNSQAVLRQMHVRNTSALDILLLDLEGNIKVQQSRVGRRRQNQVPNPTLFEEVLAKNGVVIDAVGFENRFPYLDMAVPVTDDIELPIAVLMVRVDLNELWNKTINIRVGDRGYVYITDPEGQVVAFRNTRLQEPGVMLQDLVGRSPLQIAKSGFNLYRGLDEAWVLASAQRLQVLPWFAVVERPVIEFISPIVLFTLFWVVISLVVVGLMFNMIGFNRRRIVRPLGDLRAVVRHLSLGEWDYPVAIHTQDELGELARSFRTMAQKLRESFNTLEANNQKMQILNNALTESEAKLTQFLDAVPVGILVVDAEGKPYYANPTAQRILGQGVIPSATPQTLSEAYQAYRANSNEVYPSAEQPIVRALAGQTSNIDDLEIQGADYRTPVEIWGTPIFDRQGGIIYAIAAFQDISQRRRAEQEREQLNIAYERFVPEKFLQLLNKDSILDVSMGDAVEREMSILFADICNFTTFAEQMSPEDSFQFINSYLHYMEPAVMNHGGFVDKYVGDEIMALFDRSADDAVQAAIAMLKELTAYNETRDRPDRPPIEIGIGINTGPVVLGTVGGQHRSDSTAIGDTVNLASRLERLTRVYQVPLLITHHTFWQLTHTYPYHIRLIDRVTVKGKSQRVSVFEVFDADPPDCREGKRTTRSQFEQGLMLYKLEAYYDALQFFQQCLHYNPVDTVAKRYKKACQEALAAETLELKYISSS
ncbi:MAG: HAMP domain-containing protein [Spirulina sp. SIO3F2]|nr:HAMP domain-containing protein [Spirulina sp. SIO3F2]